MIFKVPNRTRGLMPVIPALWRPATIFYVHSFCRSRIQIRKRRPTPASLVILNEHNPPEIDDKRVPNTQGELQNASPKQRKQSVYTPPTIKGVKHLKGQNESAFPEEEEGTNEREEQRDH
ncbi:protein phosphatase 1 regulatory subunit 1C isoform X2 [Pan paniscus]|uniref:protein phosphatase 1 regulatory subunit 1C isoform X2 n=1 Tax=Pan paniscus TaxID=9597 RepID=UPI00300672FB